MIGLAIAIVITAIPTIHQGADNDSYILGPFDHK
jgi:hypothetical protein